MKPIPDIPLDTTVDASVQQTVRFNHVGYQRIGPKRAVVEATAPLSRFQVVRAEDQKVFFAGDLVEAPEFTAWGGGPRFYVADFTDMDWAGRYSLYVNGQFSEPFDVESRLLFKKTISAVVDYFRQSRADDAEILAADARVPLIDAADDTGRRDLRGGWYDASGDISKYLSHLSYANYLNPQQIPLVAWTLAWMLEHADGLLTEEGLSDAVREEALWGADYLVRSLDQAGYFYVGVFDRWTGVPAARYICAFETSNGYLTGAYQAAFREGGGMSIAALARIARSVSDPAAAQPYVAAAERAFAHLQTANLNYADDGKENIIDDYSALLAATELYTTTSSPAYLEAARARAVSLAGRLHPSGYFVADGASRPFWHASDAGLPIVALVNYLQVETDAAARATASAAIELHLDYLVETTRAVSNPYGYARQHFNSGGALQSGFFIPHDNETGYWWQGENARLGSLAAAALLGGRTVHAPASGSLGVPEPLAGFAVDQLNWVLGQNPFDVSFLHGFGRNNPPAYCSSKPQHGTLVGGIANGVTGSAMDGSGISWNPPFEAEMCWEGWRWVEQWLPHSAWYMLGVTAAALSEP
jgi:hypothetical protein